MLTIEIDLNTIRRSVDELALVPDREVSEIYRTWCFTAYGEKWRVVEHDLDAFRAWLLEEVKQG